MENPETDDKTTFHLSFGPEVTAKDLEALFYALAAECKKSGIDVEMDLPPEFQKKLDDLAV